jgi:Glycine zipper 2TM domain
LSVDEQISVLTKGHPDPAIQRRSKMNKTILATTLAAIVIPAAPALAHDRGEGYYYGGGDYRAQRYEADYRGNSWQGEDGRYYCRKSNGTVGILVGGLAGGLIGRSIDRRGDRAVGTILGAAAGALLGRAVERGGSSCR